jgi:predicted nuclease of restriction endonuclease-like RecB superfamily
MKKKKINVDNIRNPFEIATYKYLKNQASNGKYVLAYEEEAIPYILEKKYVPDFILEFASGRKRYIEAKGYLRPDDMRKMVSVRKQHPDLEICIYFMKDNKLNRNSKTRYSDWATKNGFDWAVGGIPKAWLIDEDPPRYP